MRLPGPAAKTSDRDGVVPVLLLCAAQVAIVLTFQVSSIVLPTIADALALSDGERSWIVTANALASGGGLLLMARRESGGYRGALLPGVIAEGIGIGLTQVAVVAAGAADARVLGGLGGRPAEHHGAGGHRGRAGRAGGGRLRRRRGRGGLPLGAPGGRNADDRRFGGSRRRDSAPGFRARTGTRPGAATGRRCAARRVPAAVPR